MNPKSKYLISALLNENVFCMTYNENELRVCVV